MRVDYPSLDAAIYHETADDETRARLEAEADLAKDFLRAAQARNMKARASFAPLTTDWPKYRAGDLDAKRRPLVGEVLGDSLDYTDGPQLAEVMSLLCEVAYGSEPQGPVARELLKRMAKKFAEQNVGVE